MPEAQNAQLCAFWVILVSMLPYIWQFLTKSGDFFFDCIGNTVALSFDRKKSWKQQVTKTDCREQIRNCQCLKFYSFEALMCLVYILRRFRIFKSKKNQNHVHIVKAAIIQWRNFQVKMDMLIVTFTDTTVQDLDSWNIFNSLQRSDLTSNFSKQSRVFQT